MTYMERVEEYAGKTGITVEEIITQALDDWFKTVGDARLETPPCNLICFPISGNRAVA